MIWKLKLGVCIGTVLVTGIAVFLFVRLYSAAIEEAFQEKGASYAAALADTIGPWVESGDEGLVREAARLLLVGTSIYVQVYMDGTLIVDERDPGLEGIEMPPISTPPSGREIHMRADGGWDYVDVVIPYGSGYVRVGIDATPIALRTRNAALIGAGVALLFDLFILGAIHLVSRSGKKGAAERTTVEYGPLRIDDAARRVTLAGVPVPLPPKQYALLRLLASEPERVFTEEEILAAVWPDSPYADSKDIKQCVYLLRRRLGKEGGRIVVNVPGFGYKLAVSEDVDADLTGG